MGEFLAISALVLFSCNIILTKVASSRLNLHLGFLISVTVNVLFSLLLLFGQLLFRENAIQWNMLGFLLFLAAGFFNTYLGRWFFFDSIAILGPAKASTFQVSNPLFTILIAWAFMGEKLAVFDIVSIIVVLLGLFLVSYNPHAFTRNQTAIAMELIEVDPKTTKKAFHWNLLLKSGIFLAVFSTLSYAIGNVLRGAGIAHWNEPILGGLIGAAMGLFLHFVTNSNTKNVWKQLNQADRQGVLLYVISGILTITAQILVIASMWYMPISIANLITMSTPLLVTPLSYFLLKNEEGITRITIIGIVMVLVGISTIILY
jgi:drug/metabolite transporter (DMT)-like permease